MSAAEEMLALHIRAAKLPEPEREYRFAAEHVGTGKGSKQRLAEAGLRDFRFDFCWPELKLAVEVDGGMYMKGGHTSGVGASRDREKDDCAMRLGWKVYRCTPDMVKKGWAIETIEILLTMAQTEAA